MQTIVYKNHSELFFVSRELRHIVRGKDIYLGVGGYNHQIKMIDEKRLMQIDREDLISHIGKDAFEKLIEDVDWYGSVHESSFGLKEYFDQKFKELDSG